MFAKDEYKVGFFPTIMPRDPIEIDIYVEHLGVGQVLETLLKIDENGEISTNIAKSWLIEKEGRLFSFDLNENILFSNGRKLNARDVEYTINRHKNSKNSQSKNYLANIEKIEVASDYKIKFHLKEPQVSFLKVLTRDHLGILPDGWKFDKKLNEPWIGSGPYRYIQDDKDSFFIKNPLYRREKEIKIFKWKILKSDNVIEGVKKYGNLDLLLHFPGIIRESIPTESAKEMSFFKPLHFIQSSAWWYPGGKNFHDESLRLRIMSVVNQLVLELNAKNNFELATGVIPKGIQGHLPNRVSIQRPNAEKKALPIKVVVFNNDYDTFFGNEVHKLIENKYNVEFKISKYNFLDNDPNLIKPDILIGSYAGGFADPDGFLIVLGSILNIDPAKYLNEKLDVYTSASKEQDWNKRGEMFRSINEYLVGKKYIVPAWKREIYVGKSSDLVDAHGQFLYTLELEKFSPRSKD